jgi:hypothetical protein
MLSHFGTEPEPTIFPGRQDGDLGSLGRRALRENIMVDDTEQDPVGIASGNQFCAVGTVNQLGTFSAMTFSSTSLVVSSSARRESASK